MELQERQRRHLEAVAGWAEKIRSTLGPVLEAHGDRVHFRPGSKGVAMVGLLPERPQRGRSGLRNLERVARDLDTLFAAHCRDVPHGRVTGEKALQSFLVSEAHRNGRKLASLNAASRTTPDPVELVFVTDEIIVPTESSKVVCDVLALRVDRGRCTPVLIELKDARMLTRLVEQVLGYCAVMDAHPRAFERLYAATLGKPVSFDGPTEKWIIWPASGGRSEPREQQFNQAGIRVVGYELSDAGYQFEVGRAP